jgi:transglutaminase-like putative cysteine protease
MLKKLFISLSLVLFLTSISLADDVPAWLSQAASASLPTYDKDVPAVVLHSEQIVTVANDGRVSTTTNFAVKILLKEGRGLATARALYLVNASNVKELNAWTIRPTGTSRSYDKKNVIDIVSDPDDIYNEYRVKLIDGTYDTEVGAVFGYTSTTEENPLFYQDVWNFQTGLPTVLSRYIVNLPDNWTANSVTFNREKLEPQVSKNRYVWQLQNLAAIPDEPLSPSYTNLSPRVAVNFVPPNSSQGTNKVFMNWTEVSRWATQMNDSAVIVDDAVASKARELTANAKNEFEKIMAIGNYVQGLQYISIDIGVGFGNGYRPRPSNLVLARGYGDCKDKANLMRAMLKSLKIEAYPVAIYSGDPTYAREEWASPGQFNHCIIAVKVSSETNSPTVMTHPKLGRLLIFDATDPHTPVGDLPEYLQGSFGLIAAGEEGGLSKMPLTSAESNGLERKLEVTMTETGGISGIIRESFVGQDASSSRAQYKSVSPTDFNKILERWLTRASTGAKLIKSTLNDLKSEGKFNLDTEFSAPIYGQVMQGRLIIFKPVVVERRNTFFLNEGTRKTPIELSSNYLNETVVFTLPQGFTVDETPDPINLETSFGKYSTKYEIKDGKLYFTRKLLTNRMIIPIEKYNTVKEFFDKIVKAEQSPVVLVKK